MKKIFLPLTISCLLAACNSQPGAGTESAPKEDTVASSSSAAAPLTYAYTPTYTADFEMGDPKYAQTVVQIWKDFDNNTFDQHPEFYADSVYFEFNDGSNFSGSRDSMLSMLKQYRASVGNATSSVITWATLKPKGKDETWVCIWGKEIDEKNGKKDSINLNENWMFNKNGKISYMTQFAQKYMKKK